MIVDQDAGPARRQRRLEEQEQGYMLDGPKGRTYLWAPLAPFIRLASTFSTRKSSPFNDILVLCTEKKTQQRWPNRVSHFAYFCTILATIISTQYYGDAPRTTPTEKYMSKNNL